MKNLDLISIIQDYENCKNAAEVGRKHDVCGATITKYLKSCGVQTRHLIKNKQLDLSDLDKFKFVELIDGLLLGDACIDKQGCFRIEQSQKRNKWLDEISCVFTLFGVTTKIIETKHNNICIENRLVPNQVYKLLYTGKYVELKLQRSRWYSTSKKEVPRDIKLTPVVLANWFAGDGTYDKKGTLKFCTDGFLKKDVLFLISEINRIYGIECSLITERKRKNQYKIGIFRRDEAVKLKEIIMPYLSSCCHYKLIYVRKTL